MLKGAIRKVAIVCNQPNVYNQQTSQFHPTNNANNATRERENINHQFYFPFEFRDVTHDSIWRWSKFLDIVKFSGVDLGKTKKRSIK